MVGVAQPVAVPPQDAGADGMEGAGPDVEGFIAQEGVQPFLEFVGGFVGEGDGKDLPRFGGLHRQQVGKVEGEFALPVEVVLKTLHIGFRDGTAEVVGLVRLPVLDQVGDAVDQDRGLPRPGAGQHQKRSLRRGDRFQLTVVHPGKLPFDDRPAQFQKLLFQHVSSWSSDSLLR